MYSHCVMVLVPWSPSFPPLRWERGTRLFLDFTTLKPNGGLLGEEAPPICAFNPSEVLLCDLRNKAYNTGWGGCTMRRRGQCSRFGDGPVPLGVTDGRPVKETPINKTKTLRAVTLLRVTSVEGHRRTTKIQLACTP